MFYGSDKTQAAFVSDVRKLVGLAAMHCNTLYQESMKFPSPFAGNLLACSPASHKVCQQMLRVALEFAVITQRDIQVVFSCLRISSASFYLSPLICYYNISFYLAKTINPAIQTFTAFCIIGASWRNIIFCVLI